MVVFALIPSLLFSVPAANAAEPIQPEAVLRIMERAADWQLANPSRHRPTDWTQGAGYTGIMALSRISKDPKYREAMVRMGETNEWQLGPRRYHADDHVVGQTYCELHFQDGDASKIGPMRAQFDAILENPRQFETLEFRQRGIGDLWSWCDALFMGPPTWVRLWKATDDPRYLDFAVTNWWRTSDYLYDQEEHLYFRDSTYFNRREANGRKIFWSRGNGWVMGGLVRVMELLPKNHPSRPRFEQQFKEMAEAILKCQQADGLWRSSLLDPGSYPLKETSGSGFFTFALAWGVNEGLLHRARFEPAVRKAWVALAACVNEDGKLTHVQPIGADPKRFDPEATEIYGVGAFLLAGSEVYELSGGKVRGVLGGRIVLPNVIGHDMVLQQQQKVPVWGWAAAGEGVTVRFGRQTQKTKADADGRWRVTLRPMDASWTPATMTIESGESVVSLTNILVGEVWFCSGQSNMEKPLGPIWGQQPTIDFERELAASEHPAIRLFKVARVVTNAPMQDTKASWAACNSNALEGLRFSAAAYFFGREIHTNLHVPVGLIEASWGGTRIEPWTPIEAIREFRNLHRYTNQVASAEKATQAHTSALYNGMVAPVVPFGIRGAIWYQGESNLAEDNDPPTYTEKMEAMISGWRNAWGRGAFPFYFVQLAPYPYANPKRWKVSSPEALPEFWEAQARALQIRNTGLIVVTDLVDDINDIHPRNKREVGRRLAFVALRETYGRRDVESSGPVFRRMKVRDGKAIVSFRHSEGGLASRDGAPLTWFSIAGSDGQFVPADASVDGERVIVSSPKVSKPVAVRFAWHETAQPNLVNRAGLPARPFRTDAPE